MSLVGVTPSTHSSPLSPPMSLKWTRRATYRSLRSVRSPRSRRVDLCAQSSMVSTKRQHFRRMCIARLPTIHVSVATTRCQYCWGKGDKSSSEQVWTSLQWWQPVVSSGGGGYHGHMETPLNRMTDRHLWKHYLPATSFACGKLTQKPTFPQEYTLADSESNC